MLYLHIRPTSAQGVNVTLGGTCCLCWPAITCLTTCETHSLFRNRLSSPVYLIFDMSFPARGSNWTAGQPSWILLLRTKEIEYPAYSRTNCGLKCVNVSLRLFLRRQLSRVFVLCVQRLKRPYIYRFMYCEHARNWPRLMLSHVARTTAQIKLHRWFAPGQYARNRS